MDYGTEWPPCPSEELGFYEVSERGTWTGSASCTPSRTVLHERQRRMEFPQGSNEGDFGEHLLEVAKREFEEEAA